VDDGSVVLKLVFVKDLKINGTHQQPKNRFSSKSIGFFSMMVFNWLSSISIFNQIW
jgi:hypothetical protein